MEKLPSWDASRWTGLWRSSPASCLALHRFGILVPADWRARDTLFPLLSTNRVRIDLITICKMLGHKDVKMTQRYARVTQKKLFEDMDKFIAATEKDFILALWTRLSTFLFTVQLHYYIIRTTTMSRSTFKKQAFSISVAVCCRGLPTSTPKTTRKTCTTATNTWTMMSWEIRWSSHSYLGMQISKPQLNCHVTPNQLHGCTQCTYFAPDNRSMVQSVTTILTNKTM